MKMFDPSVSGRRDPVISVRRAAAIAMAAALTLAGCGSGDGADGSAGSTAPDATDTASQLDASFTIVTSEPPIADLVAQVAGDAADVVSIVPLGADSHTYEPSPQDARTLADADLYIENGMGLTNAMTEFAATNYPAGTPHHYLGEVVPVRELISTESAEQIAQHGHAHEFNAHFWPDVRYATMYVDRIAEILAEHDPNGAAGYEQRAAEYTAQLEAMDEAFQTALATIPDENRQLVVYHDSWSYYGRRYSLPVVGAIQPTDFSEPSAAELRDTIEQVRAAGVPAFFGSEVFPSDVLEAIEAETGATYVADLSDDRLPGEPGAPEHSYVGMMLQNTRIIVEALGGDASALDEVPLVRS